MARTISATLIILIASALMPACATIWCVDASVSDSGDGRTWETAFGKIQQAIVGASAGDTVIVAQGTYRENIHSWGKNITLRSTDALDPDVVANTVIDGEGAGPVITFVGTEDETCSVSGFTIRNGNAEYGGGICGGEYSRHTRCAIKRNVIRDNTAHSGAGLAYCGGSIENNIVTGNNGGGLYGCDGVVQDNTITHNSGEFGAGLAWCDGIIQRNRIADNSAGPQFGDGGGLAFCDGLIQNNEIHANRAARDGGGIYRCDGTIQNNLIHGNSADKDGGGLWRCQGKIQNNTIYENSASYEGGGLEECHGTVRNCIIWANSAKSGFQVHSSVKPTYSCIQDWAEGGQGNINEDPRFIDAAAHDFRLPPDSPCVDAGANFYWSAWPQRDIAGNSRLFGERVDLGCYEYGSSPDSDGDLCPDIEELEIGTDPLNDDTDGDGLRDGLEAFGGSNPHEITVPRIVSVPSDVAMIQEALCLAVNGDQIIVAPGTYREDVQFCGPDVVLRSSEPGNPEIVASTVIDGGGSGPVVSLTGDESEKCILSGFTLRGGFAGFGGGIDGGSPGTAHSHATIRDNVITANRAFFNGGGLCSCDGPILNNAITGNSTSYLHGGGLALCDGVVRNNTISRNVAAGSGGGLYLCQGVIAGNTISENSASDYGGGVCGCNGAIQNNLICGNVADIYGGGIADCEATIQNNTIRGNSAVSHGGGLGYCGRTIQNNLIIANSARWGAGLSYCHGEFLNNSILMNTASEKGAGLGWYKGLIRNCIIWGNASGASDGQLHESTDPCFSCIQDWTGGGKGNTVQDPLFVDEAGGDYHLQPGSPCIDFGANGYWFTWPQRDLDGNCRLAGARVDIGCYEYGSSPDSDGDLLRDSDELAEGTDTLGEDSDGDGLRDGLEILRGSNPLAQTGRTVVLVPPDVATIQSALCQAMKGDEIIVGPGTHTENIHFCGTDVVLRSQNPNDSSVVAATILDGAEAGPVVSFTGDETGDSVLAGFTICNGKGEWGGGICGGTINHHTQATVRNNVITRNRADCGAGLCFCDGLIRNNMITNNSADERGGAMEDCNGIVQSNVVAGNSAVGNGGGLVYCWGTIENNTIVSNAATGDPGIGGGLFYCDATIRNCIVWGNTANEDPQIHFSPAPVNSCIQDWTGGGEGNTSRAPLFADDSYQLLADSPCIDAGDNDAWMWEATDLQGNLRILPGISEWKVDIGAYEYVPTTYKLRDYIRKSANGIQLIWTSQVGPTYTVWSCQDLLVDNWLKELTLVCEGVATTWTDPDTASSLKFYGIEMRP